jgi:hypothetical protein
MGASLPLMLKLNLKPKLNAEAEAAARRSLTLKADS